MGHLKVDESLTNMNAPTRYVIRYRGHVQGVGFRATAQFIARDLRVDGWVRNEPDGSVVLDAQGARSDLKKLHKRILAELNQRIDDHFLDERPLVEHKKGFCIRY